MKRPATLRTCASCEWLFRLPAPSGCPQCGFAHYGARFVYGDRAYRYEVTQRPWFDRKMAACAGALIDVIEAANQRRAAPKRP